MRKSYTLKPPRSNANSTIYAILASAPVDHFNFNLRCNIKVRFVATALCRRVDAPRGATPRQSGAATLVNIYVSGR